MRSREGNCDKYVEIYIIKYILHIFIYTHIYIWQPQRHTYETALTAHWI